MATAARSKSSARRKPPARTRKTTPKPSTVPARIAKPEGPAVVSGPWPAADPVIADARDRATDIADFVRETAHCQAQQVLADAELRAQDLLDAAGRQSAAVRAAADGHARQVMNDVVEEAGRRLRESTADADITRTAATRDADQIRDQARSDVKDARTGARALAARHRAEAARSGTAIEQRAQAQAEQIRSAARREAQTLLAAAADEAATIRATAQGVLDRAGVEAEQQLASARTDAASVRDLAQAEAARVREEAEEVSVGLRASTGQELEAVRAKAASESERQLREARAAAARMREDAAREQETARQEAARVRRLAEEDVKRLRATAAEDAERTTCTAREAADRLVEQARTKRDADLEAAETVLAQARVREADAEVMLKAAEDVLAEAAARMRRATSRTEQALERKRLKYEARTARRDEKDARTAKARETRSVRRAGQPAMADRVKKFVKVNAERLMVIGPITAPMAVAWTGQAGFAGDILGWVMPFTILFAAAWELSTAFVGWMYHQARRGGDAGTLYRVSTWTFALGAAVMNFWHASGEPTPGSRVWDDAAQAWTEQITYWHFTPKAVAFAAMSIVGMVLWELYASLIHRRKLREDGKVAKARPSIGMVRWVRYPVHSFTAWSLAITDARLTTLDRAWTAAGADLADRKAVRTGRALHRVVVPRIGTDDHGPAAIPTVLTLTRMDRTGPADSAGTPGSVRTDPYAVRSGPGGRNAVHGPVRATDRPDRSAGPVLALEPGPTAHACADLRTGSGPDRTSASVPAAHTTPTTRGVTVRTATPFPGPQYSDRSGPAHGSDRGSGFGPGRETGGGPDRTVITLTDLERTALDRLRSEGKALNRSNIANAVRSEGGSIATDRAGQIAVALKQHTDR
ncbi:hypothetical protein [Streptomyces sp. ADI95-17]|uniref:hypothetical protein n=1 Tax=Streptomyces sp. ADI95-17 TaxID=1522759 RepID=UPI000F5BE62A|nr:hypothetical protein [Streptomyces sp. ADI95-17]RPK55917.1 hypothetical protein EES42_41475 [Streptomyces sp. ADI95-17]